MAKRDRQFETFIKDHFEGLKRYFVRKMVASEAYDLCNETFAAFHKAEGLAHPNQKALLYRIAHAKWVAYLRKHRPTVQFDSQSMSDLRMGTSMSSKAARGDFLLRALSSIPLEQQEAFELHYGEGHTIEELTEVLEVSRATVNRRLKAAREGLRAKVRESGGELEAEIGAAYRET